MGKQQNRRLPLSFNPYLVLGLATLACLLPFAGKAFHIDDTIYVWVAQQIVHHPLNPYGLHVVWYVTDMPVSDITKNPPLSSYYGALVGVVAGWSEVALHLGFLLPALALILGTYHLAKRFTASPVIAAMATLLAPGFLVSATGVMCDVMMVALWVWAVIFWLKGIESGKPLYLVASGLLIAACALTKYFGASLLLLLPAYSFVKQRRLGAWAWYLFIPAVCLFSYELWTKALYGRGLLWDAALFARSERVDQASHLTSGLVGLSFLGGCALPILLFAPYLWKRWQLILGSFAGALVGLAMGMHWLHPLVVNAEQDWGWVGVQFAWYVVGGIFVLGLAIADYRKRRDADSLLLALWVLGTFVFATFLNWTANARTVLPLIPAAAILLARRLDETRPAPMRWFTGKLVVPLALSAIISLSIAWGDTVFANSGRTMASFICRQAQNQAGRVFFEGHWGFQYYMQLYGARPVESGRFAFHTGDQVVIPGNNCYIIAILPQLVAAQEAWQLDPHGYAGTMTLGAGFYSSIWGPLPFSFGRVPTEYYLVLQMR